MVAATLAAGAVGVGLGLSRGAAKLDRSEPSSSEDCADCHAPEVEAWKGSRHAQSRTNDAFEVALRTAATPGWCLNCHEPVAGQDEGVSCAACHVRDELLAASEPSEEAIAAHPIRYSPELDSPRFCSGCHEFRAADLHGNPDRGGPLQTTLSEYVDSGVDATCVECHLEGHAFPGRELLADVVSVRVEEGRFVVSLVGEVGHAVPTGDPFRRLELLACEDPDCEDVLARHSWSRVHRFDGTTWWPTADNRLRPDDPVRTWTPPEGTRYWRLQYILVASHDAPHLPPEEAVLPLDRGAFP